jgi:hypothetical protein
MSSASSGRTVTLSSSKPNGRVPPVGLPGELPVLADGAAGLVVGLLACDRREDAGVELAVVGGEVDVAGAGPEVRDPGRVADLEELLELGGMAGEAVEVPDDDGVEVAALHGVEHPPVGGAVAAAVRAGVVVDEHLGDGPAAPVAVLAAVGLLAADAGALTGRVETDPAVDRCPHHAVEGNGS